MTTPRIKFNFWAQNQVMNEIFIVIGFLFHNSIGKFIHEIWTDFWSFTLCFSDTSNVKNTSRAYHISAPLWNIIGGFTPSVIIAKISLVT